MSLSVKGGEMTLLTMTALQHVIERERRGDYLGKAVQVVPHMTDAIQDWIEEVGRVAGGG